MSKACLACLLASDDRSGYHPACLQRLFGTTVVPRLDLDLDALSAYIASVADKLSLSGAQPKTWVGLSQDHTTLEVTEQDGAYLLKPQTGSFRHLPENEHTTMCLARLVGIFVPDVCLLHLQDGSAAYLIRRFDRDASHPPRRLRMEDFCQLLGMSRAQKYDGTAESCAEITWRYSATPEKDVRRLFQLLLFAYWTGNGDLHLKNLSLLEDPKSGFTLSPAYDLVCTRLVLPRDKLALPVDASERDVQRKHWISFAAHCRIPTHEAEQIIRDLLCHHQDAEAMVQRSALPVEMKRRYAHLLQKRARALGQPSHPG